MKFSILIANYNNGKYFADCYDSIIAQTYEDWEAIIVDDKSTDNSVEIISSLIKDDQRFRLFTNEINYGCGFTKGRCAELTTGEIAGFLDPDDTLVCDALAEMVKIHKENPNVSLVHSNLYFCNEKMESTSVFERAKSVQVDNKFINIDAAVTAFSSFKKSFYDRTAGIDSSLQRAVDQDLYLKLSEQGPFHFIDKPLYNYRIHENGISTSKVDHAFYWFLKVIMKAEERRGVSLENEVAQMLNRTDPHNLKLNMANPRYLLLQMKRAFKKTPRKFLNRLFLNR